MASRIISWILFFAVMGGFTYVFRDIMWDGGMQIYRMALPCTIPITYKLGTVDPKFGITKATVEADLKTAAELWNDAAGKVVIAHDQERGTVTVDMKYDSRQAITERLKQLGVTISIDKQSYEIVKAKYDQKFSEFQAKKAAFESRLAAFNAEKAAYDKEVQSWNDRGGAPRNEYLKLQTRQAELTGKSVTLMQEQNAVKAAADDVNNLAAALNNLIEILNLNVDRYNDTGEEQGGTFEQGLYKREMGVETITIFEYENNNLLIRVLAHELGHALNLDHVKDEKAIMYYLNQGEALSLTAADKAELKAVCRL